MDKNKLIDGIATASISSLIILGFLGGIGSCIGGLAYGISTNNYVDKQYEYILQEKEKLDERISKTVNLEKFDLSSVEIASNDEKFIMRAFGATTVEEVMGIKQSNYIYLLSNISSEQAKSIVEKAKQIKSLANTDYQTSEINLSEYKTYGSTMLINKNIDSRERIDNYVSASQELYNMIGEAFEKAANVEVCNIGEASTMNKAFANLNPVYAGEISGYLPGMFGGYAKLNATFMQSNVMVTNISEVVKDEKNNVSYFLLDSLQARLNGSQGSSKQDVVIESCRSKIEIEGTNLSEEEVYAQFIAGNYKRVVDVIRKNVGSTSVVDHQQQDNVDELEFLF